MIFSVFIADSAGNPLFSRHFVDESRLRLDGLISAFPHVAQAASANKQFADASQHTYLTTPSVRYVYLPYDHFLLVIVTTKDSNLIQDLRTLNLLRDLANKYCPNPSPKTIEQSKFRLIFAFDEAIILGYPEYTSLSEVETNLLMHSVEENYHNAIENEKVDYAKEVANTRLRDFEERRSMGTSMTGIGSEDFSPQAPSHMSMQATGYDSDGHYPRSGQPIPSSHPKYSASLSATATPIRTVTTKASALKLGSPTTAATTSAKTKLGSASDFMSQLSKFS